MSKNLHNSREISGGKTTPLKFCAQKERIHYAE